VGFINKLGQKVEEINTLKESNESLTLELSKLKGEKTALENDLSLANEKLSTMAEEKEKLERFLKSLEDGSNELEKFSRFALISRIHNLESKIMKARESFNNALEQVKCRNPEVNLKTA
jgi:predicted nuclease with TOPRIM domain